MDFINDFLVQIRGVLNLTAICIKAGIPARVLAHHYLHLDGKKSGRPLPMKYVPPLLTAINDTFSSRQTAEITKWWLHEYIELRISAPDEAGKIADALLEEIEGREAADAFFAAYEAK